MIKTLLENVSSPRILLMFALLVLGILAKWFWDIGWAFLRDPAAGLDFGTWTMLGVRQGLSLTAIRFYRGGTPDGLWRVNHVGVLFFIILGITRTVCGRDTAAINSGRETRLYLS